MNVDTQTQLERIRKVSRVVRIVCRILLGLTLFAFLMMVVLIIIGPECGMRLGLGGPECGTIRLGGAEIPISQLTPGSMILMFGFSVLATAVVIKGLYHLHRLFGNYADGKVFTIGSVAQIRQLGITFLLGAGLQILAVPLAVVLMILCTPDKGALLLTFPFEALITAGLLILISWVMDAGRGLREENELTI